MVKSERKEAALAAAGAAMEAAQELLRYAREGAHYRYPPFGEVDVAELLADALKQALEIEQAEQDPDAFPDDAAERDRLLKALTRFLDGSFTSQDCRWQSGDERP
jgi:hypothetical protein